ncbi:MAG: hypothetical protein U9Q97_04495 [Acidobacteriota bacterium]|nr:hypothetical protein [Acidobacteriota bacterium]
MADFLEIKCMKEKERKEIIEEIEKRIEEKKKEGLFTENEIREIEEMKLHPLLDIQDIQYVYENHLYKNET